MGDTNITVEQFEWLKATVEAEIKRQRRSRFDQRKAATEQAAGLDRRSNIAAEDIEVLRREKAQRAADRERDARSAVRDWERLCRFCRKYGFLTAEGFESPLLLFQTDPKIFQAVKGGLLK